MAVVLPGQGSMAAAQTASGATGFVLLGPLCAGCTVIRAVLHLTSDVAEICRLAMSFGISSQGNVQALNKGTPLVQRADGVVGRQPGASFLSSMTSPILFWIPVGITVQEGPRFIVAGLECGGSSGTMFWSVGVEVVEVRGKNGNRV